MPSFRVKVPRLGEAVNTVVVIEWRVGVGDHVEAGDALVVVETDKTEVEIPAPVGGRIDEILVEAEAEVAVGEPICVVQATEGPR